MKNTNTEVRRQDRLLDPDEAIQLLRSGEFGFLSMVEMNDNEYAGYGIPISYVWDGKESIYFHCAPEGHKMNCIEQNPNVSFCVVGRTNVIPDKFTTAYESIVIRGTVYTGLEPNERMQALRLLIDKYSPEHKDIGIKYSEKSFHRTAIIRLDISSISGKSKRIPH